MNVHLLKPNECMEFTMNQICFVMKIRTSYGTLLISNDLKKGFGKESFHLKMPKSCNP